MNNLNLFSIHAEQALLSSLLLNGIFLENISNVLNVDDFFFKNHKIIFSVMIEFFSSGDIFDVFFLSNKIMNLTSLNLLDIINYLEILKKKKINYNNIYNYAIIIRDMSILRKLFFISNKIINQVFLNKSINIDNFLKKIEFDIISINECYNKINNTLFIVGPIFKKVLLDIDLINKKSPIIGLSTGFVDLDKILSGLHNGDFIIIGGRPSMGKTTLAVNIAQNVSINSNLPVIIFSLEMSSSQLALRILSNISSINQHDIKSGNLSVEDFLKLRNIVNDFFSLKIFIDESISLTPQDIFLKSKKVISKYGNLGLIVIDYLQLMNSSNFNNNRFMEISEISRMLKRLAKELNIPVIAISQLNRCLEIRTNKRPILSDLRESGAIEQDADTVLFVYRDEIYNPLSLNKGLAEILISKQRNGPVGVVNLYFFSNILKFTNPPFF